MHQFLYYYYFLFLILFLECGEWRVHNFHLARYYSKLKTPVSKIILNRIKGILAELNLKVLIWYCEKVNEISKINGLAHSRCSINVNILL